jgi:hypothetical protein
MEADILSRAILSADSTAGLRLAVARPWKKLARSRDKSRLGTRIRPLLANRSTFEKKIFFHFLGTSHRLL